ncbi:bifunctional metallophosphatase/5'-nucleotidase [Nocardioides sp.]|uniref:bifunctional metallophosphatase/5'-nucleotidase n=1 Tax=Nocardioides sp. TaxID=35761 RepID=UPI002ED64099
MQLSSRRTRSGAVAALAATALVAGCLTAASASVVEGPDAKRVYQAKAKPTAKDKVVKLDLLAFNDFHGQLEVVPSTSSSGRINNTPAGGAAYLAALLDEERSKSRAAGATPITVAAGDLIGASPLLSAAFHDEPTIEAMNMMGLQVASVGNHEFDEGWRELQRMQNGGCLDDGDGENGADSCPGGKSFDGADFTYLGANVVWKDPSTQESPTPFPGVKVMEVQKEKVAFIGMTLEATDTIVSPAGIQEIDFADEVETANALVPGLQKRGIKSIIVLLHEGVQPADPTAYNDCTGVSGPGLEIAQNLSPAIDAVVSGHTHQPYNCVVDDPNGNPRLLTSAASLGRIVSKLHFLINAKSGDIVRPAAFAHNTIVENAPGEPTHQGILDLIDLYTELVAPIRDEVIGHIDPGTSITRTPDANGGDSPLGNLIADAQKADTTIDDNGAPVIALMNPGGIRADLVENAAGDITYGAAFSVQPFNNLVASIDLTGAEIKAILEQQWNGGNEGTNRKILQVSGLSYTWDLSAALESGASAIVGDVLVDDDGDPSTAMVPLVDGDSYRVVANNFIVDGGDNFTGFSAGENRITGGLDIDSLVTYLRANDPVAPTPTDRISQQP